MSAPETLLIPARVHGRVLVRRGAPPARGVLVGFHGYAEHATLQLERLASAAGAAPWTLVAVQGLNRFYRGRSRETVAGWMTREDRVAAIADNVAYVDAALDAVAGEATLPLVLTGFSQGVAMAFRAAVRGRRPAAAVVAVGGDVPPELLDEGEAAFPRVLLVRGDADEWYTAEQLAADAAALSARGATVATRSVTGAHEWTPAVSNVVGQFLDDL